MPEPRGPDNKSCVPFSCQPGLWKREKTTVHFLLKRPVDSRRKYLKYLLVKSVKQRWKCFWLGLQVSFKTLRHKWGAMKTRVWSPWNWNTTRSLFSDDLRGLVDLCWIGNFFLKSCKVYGNQLWVCSWEPKLSGQFIRYNTAINPAFMKVVIFRVFFC